MLHDYSIIYDDIKLVPLNAEDSLKYAHTRNKKENEQYFFTHDHISDEAQLKWFEGYLKDETAYMFSCYWEGKWIGCNCMYHIDGDRAEYGRLIIDRDFCPSGKGIGTKMIVAAARIAFEHLGINCIYTEIFDNNIPSIKCNERAGFKFSHRFVDDEGRGILHYEMTRDDLIEGEK